MHFCQPCDYEEWRRDRLRPAAKRLADLNAGEPRMVRLVYFLPNDRPFRQEMVDSTKVGIRRVQNVYAEQMQAHGYGNTTFRIETDAQGEPLVHRVDGRHSDKYYLADKYDAVEEVGQALDLKGDIYLNIVDLSEYSNGFASRRGKVGRAQASTGHIEHKASLSRFFSTTAHELGHAFGLRHDFRDDRYIMGYTKNRRAILSACAAEFLAVHPYFNPSIPVEEGSPPTIKILSPLTYSQGTESVTIRIEFGDSDGLHQVQLTGKDEFGTVLKACRGLEGRKAVMQFEYDGILRYNGDFAYDGILKYHGDFLSLSDLVSHPVGIGVVDAEGNLSRKDFALAVISPHLVAVLEGSDSVPSVSFSPDGVTLASGSWDGTVKLWDVETRRQIATLEGHTSHVLSVSFSPDGATLASGSWDKTVKLWDVGTRRQIVTLEGHNMDWIHSVSFSPDGATLASGSWDRTVKLWDIGTRRQIATLEGHTNRVHSVSFSPDGAILASGSWDNTVKLWDIGTRRQIATLEGHTNRVHSVSFSPGGVILASGSGDGTVTLWDVETRRQIATLEGHSSRVTSVSFSPDGVTLASGSADGTVRLWDVLDGKELVAFGVSGEVQSVSVSHTILAAGGRDGSVRLWEISNYLAPPTPNPDFDGDGTVGFQDFLLFAGAWGLDRGDAGYDARFDLDGNGTIGFRDFLVFAESFGRNVSSAGR